MVIIIVKLFLYLKLTRIETLHNKDYVHRDIKPENFCMGAGRNGNILYLIDFGLAKKYRDSKIKIHNI